MVLAASMACMRALGEGKGRGVPIGRCESAGGRRTRDGDADADADCRRRRSWAADWRCLQAGASDGGRAPQLLGVCLTCSWQAFAGSRCEYAPRLVNIDALVSELDRAGLAQPAADRSKNKQRITSPDQNRERSR